ncbi:MAG: SAM hydrolase/SAM-dependent halogenase family protein [Actinomycetota bacterium]
MAARLDVISFLSDYGRADEFVGVCHGVMAELAPHARVVDVTHDVPPFDVRAGALTLVRAIQYLPEGVVLAVVDPGVGTDRRAIAVEVERGFLVGPDNGLLAPAVAMLGGPARVVELTNAELQLPAPGPTFAGRDVMAPAAAHIANGVPIGEFGPDLDPAALAPALVPLPEATDDGCIAAEVLWVDHYGNCQLNVGPEQLAAAGAHPGDTIELRLGERGRRARWVHTFADAKPSELVLLVDSYGAAALALDRASAAAELALRAGSKCMLAPPGAAGGR